MTRTGWAAMIQKMMPWMLVEIISSDTPIIFSVFSAGVRKQREFLRISALNKLVQMKFSPKQRTHLMFYPEVLQR